MGQRRPSAYPGAALTTEPRRGTGAQTVGSVVNVPSLPGRCCYLHAHKTLRGLGQPPRGRAGLFYTAWS